VILHPQRFEGPEKNKLRRRAWQAVLSVFFSRAVRVGEQFVLVPCFLSAWGLATYGEWLTLTAIAGFVSFTNIGLAGASASDIVMAMSAGDRERAERSFANCVLMLCAIGAVVLLILILVCLTVDIRVAGGFGSISNRDAVVILTGTALAVVLGFFNAPLGAVIGESVGAGVTNSLLAVLKALEITSIGGAVLLAGVGPAVVATIGLLWAAVVIVSQVVVVRRVAPAFRLRIFGAELNSLLQIVRPSLAYFALFVSANVIAVQVPRLILFSILGSSAVAIFSVMVTYSRTVRSLSGILTTAMQIELGRLFGSGERQRFGQLIERLCRVTNWTAIALGILLLVGSPVFIPLWTNGRISVEWPLLTALIGGACVGSLADAFLVALISINHVGKVAIAHLVSVAVGLSLGGLLASHFGFAMIAAGLILPEIVVIRVARSELSQRLGTFGGIRFGEVMRWPSDLLLVEFETIRRSISAIARNVLRSRA
jgi:O-antigen/teichoic acid export membrane protein